MGSVGHDSEPLHPMERRNDYTVVHPFYLMNIKYMVQWVSFQRRVGEGFQAMLLAWWLEYFVVKWQIWLSRAPSLVEQGFLLSLDLLPPDHVPKLLI